jgi:acetylornithine deacetylase/succinyl-diaminopimelate desuccinylase-like protein
MTTIEDHVRQHRSDSLEELKELLRIPSVSTDESKKGDMARCADFVLDRMKKAGLTATILPTGGHPAVYGERLAAPGKPTVLVYGHYDVQPPDPLNLWRHGPFEPTIEGEYLVARGATDDKGQAYALLKGIEASFRTRGELPVNVKVLIEGEEEIGSPNLGALIRKEKKRFACDWVVIADSSQFAKDVPAITYAGRASSTPSLSCEARRTSTRAPSAARREPRERPDPDHCGAGAVRPGGDPSFYDDVRPIEAGTREFESSVRRRRRSSATSACRSSSARRATPRSSASGGGRRSSTAS